jgi:hypothetical protein
MDKPEGSAAAGCAFSVEGRAWCTPTCRGKRGLVYPEEQREAPRGRGLARNRVHTNIGAREPQPGSRTADRRGAAADFLRTGSCLGLPRRLDRDRRRRNHPPAHGLLPLGRGPRRRAPAFASSRRRRRRRRGALRQRARHARLYQSGCRCGACRHGRGCAEAAGAAEVGERAAAVKVGAVDAGAAEDLLRQLIGPIALGGQPPRARGEGGSVEGRAQAARRGACSGSLLRPARAAQPLADGRAGGRRRGPRLGAAPGLQTRSPTPPSAAACGSC